jgi:hypothetical protein
MKRAKSFGGKADNAGTGACYKCHEEGHWSSGGYFLSL